MGARFSSSPDLTVGLYTLLIPRRRWAVTYLTTLQTEDGKHRLHRRINNFMILMSSLATAVNVTVGNAMPKDNLIGMESQIFNLHLAFFTEQFLPNVINDVMPRTLEIQIRSGRENQVQKQNEERGLETKSFDGYTEVFYQTIAPMFVEFYEAHKQWLYENINREPTRWPSILNFGRTIRNSLSHGNKIWFDRGNVTPVSWYTIAYGPADNGRQVVQNDLSIGDVIILMFEMNDALDSLTCPIF